MIRLSRRVQAIQPSATLTFTAKILALLSEGVDVISLTAGEPNYASPDVAKSKAIEAIEDNFTRYTQVDGIPEMKQAIISWYQRFYNLSFAPDEVITSTGAKHCLFNLLQCVTEAEDEVIFPAPYWVSYPDMAKVVGANPVIVKTGLETSLKMTPEMLRNAITSKSRVFILNNPVNPTGVVYTESELLALAEVLRDYPEIIIASDDIYDQLYWGNEERVKNILEVAPDLRDRTVLINSVSKSYAMCGWRIGYAVGPKEVIAAMKKFQSQSLSNPCSVSQKAAIAALELPKDALKEQVDSYHQRYQMMYDTFSQFEGIVVQEAQGAFYLFPCIEPLINQGLFKDDRDFCQQLLDKARIGVIPGSAFGMDGYFRMSLATAMDKLEIACECFKVFYDEMIKSKMAQTIS
ncbi:pyridoxal phosphate-dependent aminotransferase [Thiotrichales bacterium 19S9-12]|nr:pyridoxal phosphate-dependent aminotransferase [Thiotrichales bacterium 19S9-11]MCF6811225.1 pyridoxal phosphate-dependent aminotransferase [Thiotrichales bacterium 19S9-12]